MLILEGDAGAVPLQVVQSVAVRFVVGSLVILEAAFEVRGQLVYGHLVYGQLVHPLESAVDSAAVVLVLCGRFGVLVLAALKGEVGVSPLYEVHPVAVALAFGPWVMLDTAVLVRTQLAYAQLTHPLESVVHPAAVVLP